MLSLFRPSFEVVKEGWILNSGLVVIPTKHHKVQSGYSGRFWDIISGWQIIGLAQYLASVPDTVSPLMSYLNSIPMRFVIIISINAINNIIYATSEARLLLYIRVLKSEGVSPVIFLNWLDR